MREFPVHLRVSAVTVDPSGIHTYKGVSALIGVFQLLQQPTSFDIEIGCTVDSLRLAKDSMGCWSSAAQL
jgi:hypothetical protein